MATEFDPNFFAFGDRAGQGRWEIGHYRQHERYISHLAALSPPVILAEQPIISIGKTELERRVFLNAHEVLHELIRPYANVTGIDLSLVDLDNEREFYIWHDVHAEEHRLIDQAFGLG